MPDPVSHPVKNPKGCWDMIRYNHDTFMTNA